MLDPAAPSNPMAPAEAEDAPEGVGAPRALIERQLWILGRLAEAGLNLALAIERQATAEEAAPAAASEAALAYGRVSRAVRLTLALQAKVVQDLQALDEIAGRRLDGERSNAERERLGLAQQRRDRAQRIVERVIEAEASCETEADRLADEACERLEHDDIYGDLTTRPVGEIIALVCRDLGLSPDWARLAEEAWAQDEIRSGAAASPFAARAWPDRPQAWAAADPGRAEPRAASP